MLLSPQSGHGAHRPAPWAWWCSRTMRMARGMGPLPVNSPGLGSHLAVAGGPGRRRPGTRTGLALFMGRAGRPGACGCAWARRTSERLVRNKLLNLGARGGPGPDQGPERRRPGGGRISDCTRETSLRLLMALRREGLTAAPRLRLAIPVCPKTEEALSEAVLTNGSLGRLGFNGLWAECGRNLVRSFAARAYSGQWTAQPPNAFRQGVWRVRAGGVAKATTRPERCQQRLCR